MAGVGGVVGRCLRDAELERVALEYGRKVGLQENYKRWVGAKGLDRRLTASGLRYAQRVRLLRRAALEEATACEAMRRRVRAAHRELAEAEIARTMAAEFPRSVACEALGPPEAISSRVECSAAAQRKLRQAAPLAFLVEHPSEASKHEAADDVARDARALSLDVRRVLELSVSAA